MVIEAGAPGVKPNDKAAIISPVYTKQGPLQLCALFFYYMDGKDLGTLNVYINMDKKGWKSAYTATGTEVISLCRF